MAAPAQITNVEKVMQAVEALLLTINNANGFRTDGLVVLRGKNPTGNPNDFTDEFKRLGAAVGIGTGHREESPPRTGGVRRYRYIYPLNCVRLLTVEEIDAGRTLDGVVEDLIDDLCHALDPDQKIKSAWAAKHAAYAYVGEAFVSCIGHHIVGSHGDESTAYPYSAFTAVAQFDYDRPLDP